MSKKIKQDVYIGLSIISILSFAVGVTRGWADECSYNSIASRINIPYVLGCELTKPRWGNNE